MLSHTHTHTKPLTLPENVFPLFSLLFGGKYIQFLVETFSGFSFCWVSFKFINFPTTPPPPAHNVLYYLRTFQFTHSYFFHIREQFPKLLFDFPFFFKFSHCFSFFFFFFRWRKFSPFFDKYKVHSVRPVRACYSNYDFLCSLCCSIEMFPGAFAMCYNLLNIISGEGGVVNFSVELTRNIES